MRFLSIHPENPQLRLVTQVVAIVRHGGIAAYPTDSGYALGCHIGDKAALERIRKIRKLDVQHNFTLMCRDLSELATYAKVSNQVFRLLKTLTPGPYTFILNATREVPRRLQHPRRKTIGLRVPAHPVSLALLEALGEPMMSVTLILPDEDNALADPEEIRERLGAQLDVIIDGGHCGYQATTVIDMVAEPPVVVRQGKGESSFLLEQ